MFVVILSLFTISPFGAFIVSLTSLSNRLHKRKNVLFLLAVISLFMAFLAYTQSSEECDIQNYYRMIRNAVPYDHSWSSLLTSIEVSYLQDKYPVFTTINGLIYWSTGNVQLVSLLWIFITYFFCFLGCLNIFKYFNIILTPRVLAPIVIGTIFSLVYFTQATEIIKQAVCASWGFYAVSLYLTGKKTSGILLFIIGYFIHFSILFYVPWIFADKIHTRKLFKLVLLSFLLRPINSMDLFTKVFSGFSFLGGAVERAYAFTGEMENFFQSSAPYFVIAFLLMFLSAMYVYFVVNKKEHNPFLNCVFLMLIILNLSYSTSHNFTRLLTLSFPCYCILIIIALKNTKYSIKVKYFIMLLLILNMALNYKMAWARLGPNSTWKTSYMNNSVRRIIFSPSWKYVEFDFDKPKQE